MEFCRDESPNTDPVLHLPSLLDQLGVAVVGGRTPR